MLLLDRRKGEAITVDGPARVTIVRMKGGRVKLGIEAEPTTKVLRAEIAARDRNGKEGESHGG